MYPLSRCRNCDGVIQLNGVWRHIFDFSDERSLQPML